VNFKRRLDPETKLGLRLTLIVLAFVLVAVPFAFLLLEVLLKGPITRSDQRFSNQINNYNLRDPGALRIARMVSLLGSTLVLAGIVLAVTVYLAAFHRRRRQALFLVTTSVLGLLLNNVLKALVGRARPHFANTTATAIGSSFPSGHAMNSMVVYSCLLILAWSRLRSTAARLLASAATAILVLAIAASRVVLTVHYVSDVVAGMVLGLAFTLASAATFTTWRQEGGHLPKAVENAPTVGEVAHTDSVGAR
jgi:undecaprenyl-diphosphatase